MSDDVPGEAAPGNLETLAARAIAIAKQTAGTQEAIVTAQGKSRRTVRWLIVSVALDITLSVVVLLLAGHQASITRAIHESQLQACAIGNDFRARQAQVWQHVLAVSVAPASETPAERAARLKRVADFRVYVARQFHPVNCTALYRQ